MSDQRTVGRFRSLAEVARLVEQFEDCTLPVRAWNHAAHLTVALWYLLHHQEHRATERFIWALRRYNRANGLRVRRRGGYHETLTLFWLAVARRYLCRNGRGRSSRDLINAFLREYGHRKGLVFDHYRSETLWSDEARFCWVAPDLKPLG